MELHCCAEFSECLFTFSPADDVDARHREHFFGGNCCVYSSTDGRYPKTCVDKPSGVRLDEWKHMRSGGIRNQVRVGRLNSGDEITFADMSPYVKQCSLVTVLF